MLPEMYILINPNPFHLNWSTQIPSISTLHHEHWHQHTSTNSIQMEIWCHTREKRSRPSALSTQLWRTTTKQGQTNTKCATTHSKSTLTMLSKLHHQQLHQQKDGTWWCPFMTSSISSRQHTVNKTQCHAPEQHHIIGTVQHTGTSRNPIWKMHRRPRDCDSRQKSVQHLTTLNKNARSHLTMWMVPAQPWGLGTQAHYRSDINQFKAIHPRSIPNAPHIGYDHVSAEWTCTTLTNGFAGLTINEDSDEDTAKTIAGTINSHMANPIVQTAATISEHAMQKNASSLQQLATNATQLHQQHTVMNQMAMMTINNGVTVTAIQQTIAWASTQIYQPAVLPQYKEGYSHTSQQWGGCGRAGGQGGGQSQSGRA